MLYYYINSIFFNLELFLITINNILKNNILTCSCWASVESWLLWRYASRSSLLYSGFRYTIELPLQPYKIQLYTFWVQGLAFFLPWFPDYSLYNVLKDKISDLTTYTCVTASTDLSAFSLFIRQNFITINLQPVSIPPSKYSSLLRLHQCSSKFETQHRLCITSSIKAISQFYSLSERNW